MTYRSPLLILAGVLPLLVGCVGPFAARSGPAAEALDGIMDPAVRQGTLDNGLRFFIRHNGEPANRAELRLAVNVGSILEDDDQLGLAHFLEHMAFNGTRSFEHQELVGYLESIGMRFGPDVNAYTSFDETVYMLTLPTDEPGTLDTGVKILEEWASAITLDSLQIEKERGVVIEEWRLGQGAGSRLQHRQFPTLARGSRYAERLPIGTYESLTTFSHEALRRFYRDWYRPDLMAVVAVGDFDVDEMEALIRERFGRIPAAENPRRRREYDIPHHRETLVSVAQDPELTSSSVSMYLKRRPRAWNSTAAYREWITESLASAMLVNRLTEYTQRADSPFLDVSSFQGRFVRTLTTFVLNARTPELGSERGLETLLAELERAARFGFTASELEREQREMLRAMEQRFVEREKTTSSSYAADYVSNFLYGGALLDLEREFQLYNEMIPSVTLREANAVARRWTVPSDRVVLVSVPERPGVAPPRDERLVRIIQAAGSRSLSQYSDYLSDAPLIRDLPQAGTIASERWIPSIEAWEWVLGNGSRVVLKPTTFREEEVLFAARSPGGTSLFPDEDHIAALTASAVVQSGGLGELSANDLRKRLAGSVAGVGADIGDIYEGLSGAASPRDLETLFQLIYLKFTAPRADSSAFLAYQTQARASLANRSASPEAAFQDTLRMTLAQYHPRVRLPSPEMFDELNMERSFEIYRDRFADASDFTFFLVGSFDPEQIRPYVLQYVASLPGAGRQESPRDLGIRPPEGVVRRTVYRGLEPRALTQIVFTGEFDFQRSNVMAIQSLADLLRMRLRDNLREELGGTYGVDVRGAGIREPYPRFQFSIGFASDPHRVDELVAAVFEEVQSLQRDGPTEDDIAKLREMQFRSRELDFRQNHFWMNQLMAYTQNAWDLEEIPTSAARSTTLSPEILQQAAMSYLDPSNYVKVVLLPESSREAS
jgi:zinc protease